MVGSVPVRLTALAQQIRPSGSFVLAALGPAVAAAVTLALVIPTLAPGVLDWDTAEFQTVGPVLGTAHPTGYPAYTILGFVVSHVLPFGDPAYRMNLLQAILAAGAVAGTAAVVQYLTRLPWVGLASGLLFLTMPTETPKVVDAASPGAPGFVTPLTTGPTLWSIATHADPHLFHLALVTLLFLTLLIWDRRRRDPDEAVRARSGRWLVASAVVYGVAVANHSLALLLPPAIALFVFLAAPRILLEWRLVAACAIALAVTMVLLFAELPIRAAMNAPLVYGHPDSVSGFQYVVLAEQFRGSLIDPLANLPQKYALVMNALADWLGPLGYLGLMGLGSSLFQRPRFVVLALVSAGVTCLFSAGYANAAIDRYFLVPLFVAFVFVGLGLADLLVLLYSVPDYAAGLFKRLQLARGQGSASPAPAEAADPAGLDPRRHGLAALGAGLPIAIEAVVALALIGSALTVVPVRESNPSSEQPGGVSMADSTWRANWMKAVLSPPLSGGLPEDAVIVSWWSDSTTLWYGQKVLGLRPDVLIVDDSTRVNDNMGEVTDVIDRFLGKRPVFLDRLDGGGDGMAALSSIYDLNYVTLPDGSSLAQVISKRTLQ